MVWIVAGAMGQLGTALCDLDPATFHGFTRAELDITNLSQIHKVLSQPGITGVINTAAYNFVDRAEEEIAEARRLNVEGPQLLAQACQDHQIPLVQISTDYLFGGTLSKLGGWKETDPVAPQGIYAQSKWEGEEAVRTVAQRHFIVRTCGVYGRTRSIGKGNFVETMLRLGRERGEVRVVGDQMCTPTSALELARGLERLITTCHWGTYHFTADGCCSWYQFAQEIFHQAGLKVTTSEITTAQFAARAPRPSFSVLNCSKFHEATDWKPQSWEAGLAEYLCRRGVV